MVINLEQLLSKGPKSCEGHLSLILFKRIESLVIKEQSHTIINDVSYSFEKADIKKSCYGNQFQKQEE